MNIILIGPRGSGKSPFVKKLNDLSSIVLYISTGKITRSRIAEGGEIAERIEQIYLTGQAWPDIL
jgi:adenylate kinase family enzyme